MNGDCFCQDPGFYFDVTSSLCLPFDRCDNCYDNNQFSCLSNSVPTCPLKGCSVIDTALNVCLRCQDTFYLDSSFLCQPCAAGCQTCFSPQMCTKCQDKYELTVTRDGLATCAQGCASGLLPSEASLYYFVQSSAAVEQAYPVSELLRSYTPVYNNSQVAPVTTAVAIGKMWEPIFTTLWQQNQQLIPIVTVLGQNFHLTLQCLPCQYYCNGNCDVGYLYFEDTMRCVKARTCPPGYALRDGAQSCTASKVDGIQVSALTLRPDGKQNMNQDLALTIQASFPLKSNT